MADQCDSLMPKEGLQLPWQSITAGFTSFKPLLILRVFFLLTASRQSDLHICSNALVEKFTPKMYSENVEPWPWLNLMQREAHLSDFEAKAQPTDQEASLFNQARKFYISCNFTTR
jgi:hypothetical protein